MESHTLATQPISLYVYSNEVMMKWSVCLYQNMQKCSQQMSAQAFVDLINIYSALFPPYNIKGILECSSFHAQPFILFV